jgi:hypothetical protein
MWVLRVVTPCMFLHNVGICPQIHTAMQQKDQHKQMYCRENLKSRIFYWIDEQITLRVESGRLHLLCYLLIDFNELEL